MDPILHLVRNAVSHGLETPLEREAAGKDPEGTLTLRASTVAETVILDIQDDGRGIDEDEVAQRARKLGLIDVPTSENASATLDLICTPGFSTREEADRAAGRGIGMAVVKNTVLALGGSLSLDTELGRGSHFTIQLPLTLAIADALIVSVGGERFAVPQSAVLEVIEVDSSAVKAFESNEIITHREKALPLFRLARVFGLQENNLPTFHAFVIGKGLSAVGVAVDRILGQREIVVRAINDPLVRVPGIAGATELGDGHIVLILDPADLNRAAREVSLAANARGMLGRETV
jgi:two-component system chemotaxis sensor kinase CheA